MDDKDRGTVAKLDERIAVLECIVRKLQAAMGEVFDGFTTLEYHTHLDIGKTPVEGVYVKKNDIMEATTQIEGGE